MEYIHTIIDNEINEYGILPNSIILGGFSRGCWTLIHSGMTYKKLINSIICCSGFLKDFTVFIITVPENLWNF